PPRFSSFHNANSPNPTPANSLTPGHFSLHTGQFPPHPSHISSLQATSPRRTAGSPSPKTNSPHPAPIPLTLGLLPTPACWFPSPGVLAGRHPGRLGANKQKSNLSPVSPRIKKKTPPPVKSQKHKVHTSFIGSPHKISPALPHTCKSH